jgi:hypothetical protein
MSFSFEFTAKQEDAQKIVDQEHAPSQVKSFLHQSLDAFKPEALVHVKATGHLYHNDYQTSTAEIKVYELSLRTPKAESQA